MFPDAQKFSNGNKSCCYGYCIDLLRMLAEQCNFTYSLHLSFNEYGSLERNNHTGKQEWNGLIGNDNNFLNFSIDRNKFNTSFESLYMHYVVVRHVATGWAGWAAAPQ